ncbi:UDP-N-acetylmuramoyl-L-alanyl-D-glutamate--2,6-diaminopimelate ligase [Anaerococcus prevotii]|uniref:UDP-N-acetylmuramyl-tripeptide synthetase n=1 Tax=Anaerococcus prevotii ACS-065-V-Col13 TaxID=879305 RepID=F0GXQ2_9FIRM|nr:UDP-N-acetylmuramoyl-L-alanyl-D-glutamate--2,6-diaminopimelate ligase [Anaerococcus prevotii]EGC81380.1 UDP-N-acetylmuramoyl-L-alanyl-D-glutamate--2,6-diaminopimelate ligase [Anaerococcus prevotii ACS-065-V-Col13]
MLKFEEVLETIAYISCEKNNEKNIVAVANNSKEVKEGYAFVAIKGNIEDGHKYIDSAIENGASLIIHTEDIAYKEGISYIKVEDGRCALAEISNKLSDYPSKKMTIVSVTGSNGKTTTSRLVYFLLDEIFGKAANIGTDLALIGGNEYRTSNTTPVITEVNKLMNICLDENIKYLSLESSSHGLDQKRIYGLDIDYGVFTNLSKEHLDYHKTMDNYFKAKMILFDQAKHTVANIDDPYGKKAKELYPNTITYGINNENADYRAENVVKKDGKVSYEVKGVEFILNTIADYEVYNTLAATAVVCDMGASLEEVKDAMKKFNGVASRFEYMENNLGLNIIIDFAHTPFAYECLFKSVPQGHKIYAVYGINGDRNKEFRVSTGKACADNDVFSVVTTDDPKFDTVENISKDIIEGIKSKGGEYVNILDREDAIKYAITHANKGDFIFLLGKGEENFLKLKGNEKTPYSERETLKEVLESI